MSSWLRIKLYHKWYDFIFSIVNTQFICSNIPAAPSYEVYLSQLIRYSKACSSYQNVLDRWLLLTRKLLNQGSSWLIWSHHFESFTVTTMTWLTVLKYLYHKWPWIPVCSAITICPSSFMTYQRFVTRVAQVDQELLTLLQHLSSPPVFSGVYVAWSLVFCSVL